MMSGSPDFRESVWPAGNLGDNAASLSPVSQKAILSPYIIPITKVEDDFTKVVHFEPPIKEGKDLLVHQRPGACNSKCLELS